MAFDIQQTQRSVPGRSGGVTFQADLSTGQAGVAAAAGQLAGAVQDLAVTLNRLQAENQLAEAQRQTDEALNKLAIEFETDPDSSTYQKRFDETMGQIQQFTPKNKLAARAFANMVKNQRVAGNMMVQKSMLARERDTKRADVALMMTKGQFGRARKAIQSGIKDGTYTKVEAEALTAESRAGEAVKNRRVYLDDLAQKGIALALTPEFAGPKKAREWLARQEGLSSAERNEIKGRIDGAVADQEDEKKAARRSIVINVGEEVSNIEDAGKANERLNELIKEHQLDYSEQNEVRGRMSAERAVKKEAKEAKDNEITNEVVTKLQELAPDTADYINANVEDATERDKWLGRFKTASERRLRGDNIITSEKERGRLLDLAASIAWPERQVKIADVLRQANAARYDEEIIDDAAYNEVRDAIRVAREDKSPFAESYIETAIGELMTGAPSSVLGIPLPTLRTREDYMKYATNKFGRFTTRIPGVMEVINGKFPPPVESKQVEAAPENPAYDYDGESIGYYNKDGSITLNKEGQKRLFELAGNDAEKARELALEQRYVIPAYRKKADPESWEVWIRAMENRQ